MLELPQSSQPSKFGMRRLSHLLPLLPISIALAQPSFAAAESEVPSVATPSNAAQKEIERRHQTLQDAQQQTVASEADYQAGQYDRAAQGYLNVLGSVPAAPNHEELREVAKLGYTRAAIKQAEALIEKAKFVEARVILLNVLSNDINPRSAEAQALLGELDDPTRYEAALTPEHAANVEQVSQHLTLGNSYLNVGNYDAALKSFEAALRIDKYNSAARRGMERVEQQKSQYAATARDHTRGAMLSEVDRQWETPVAPSDVSGLFGAISPTEVISRRDGINARLNAIRLPRVDLQNTTLEEVVEFMRLRSRELDPDKRGIDFVVRADAKALSTPITLSLQDVPLQEVLRYATTASGTAFAVDDFAVTISSVADLGNVLISKTYRVPPDFLQSSPLNDPAPGVADPFGATGNTGGGLTVRRVGAKEFLEQRGISFPEGSSASYNPSTGMLFVRNSSSNMSLIDSMVDAAAMSVPKQVEITVKMIEINETKLNELGFDWLMSPFNVPGSSGRMFGAGGSPSSLVGSDVAATWADGSAIGDQLLTGGLRSAPALESAQSIDSLIQGVNGAGAQGRSPGTFALTGVFTDPQFQLIIRALNQQKGVDVMAAPSIVARSGQRANVTISREFPYPTDFDPPEIPQQFGSDVTATPITPSTPTTFETRDVGVVLEVEPVISADNSTVDLSLTPSSTEFEGFIDYGTDIMGSTAGPFGTTYYSVQNDILQPIFNSRKINTSVTVYDGATIVLGGVMQERMGIINDKVPFLGDIPLVGRSFQSKVSKTEKKNVLFFVTVRLIDPAGRSLNAAPEPAEEIPAIAPIMTPIVEFSK